MSILNHYTSSKRSIAPDRWIEKWGRPLPPHPGRLLKKETGISGSDKIISLTSINDVVFIGHGDYDANDGPTMMVSLDPISRTYKDHSVWNTESLQVFKEYDGIVYSPFIDPTGYWEPTLPYATYPPQSNQPGTIDAIHVFDMTKYDNKLWVCGSARSDDTGIAAVWWSDDSGLSWTKTTPSNIPGDFERVYRIGAVNGKLYVPLKSSTWAETADWYQWDGETWIPSTYPGPDPVLNNPVPPFPIPAGGVTAKTSTHWILGTTTGDIYTKEI